MGSVCSSSSKDLSVIRSKKIDNELKKQKDQDQDSNKLLLLGAGESGKSTVLKQMRVMHKNGFTQEEKKQQKCFIHLNVLEAITNIVAAMKTLGIPYENEQRMNDAELILKLEREEGKSIEVCTCLTAETVTAIKHLWKDNGVQKCYTRRSEYQLLDSAKFFLDDIDRIGADDYLPTLDDILRCRLKTTGVIEIQFQIETTLFRVVDVGGQRSERKKWINCFDDVKAIVFVTSLSEYDQTLEEYQSMNRMIESLNLFNWICNHKTFINTSIILFLNKEDIFMEKITTVPITVTFPEYEGMPNADAVKEFIKDRFLRENKNPERHIYAHFTCATDTNQLSFVINSVTDTLMQNKLNELQI